jgi:isopentenyl-diphosphate delta-isomerase
MAPADGASQAFKAGQILVRKSEHIEIAVELGDQPGSSAGWSDIVLVHDALPDVDFESVDISTTFLGHRIPTPLLISGMTGGHPDAVAINRALARAAHRTGVMIGVGSQRIALTNPSRIESYTVIREEAPDAFVLANLGIGQLLDQDDRPALTVNEVRAAVKMVDANAVAIHLNFLEELVQPEGQTRARGASEALRILAADLEVPVVVKETGCGLSREVALRLRDLGVGALDVGGWGGTSFALIEAMRARTLGEEVKAQAGATLAEWGIPTAASVALCSDVLPTVAVGGIRNGLDAAKAIALGAAIVGVGRPLLACALAGPDEVEQWIDAFAYQLRAAIFLSGAAELAGLKSVRRLVTGRTSDWIAAFGAGSPGAAR